MRLFGLHGGIHVSLLRYALSAICVCVAADLPGVHGSAWSQVQVGTRCQQEYQNGWQTDVGNNDVWRRCQNFNNTIRPATAFGFYYNLHGAKPVLEQTNDGCGWGCGSLDAVDIFYVNTHGGANSTTAFWSMWDQNSRAFTSNMRLGDTNRQLMVLAQFVCRTLQTSDGPAAVLARWSRAFSGGLVMTVGSHGNLFSGNEQSATEFANRMRGGEPIGQAWLQSAWYADNDNQPTVLVTGANEADCWNRMGSVRLQNLLSTPILRDSQVGYMCWSSWD